MYKVYKYTNQINGKIYIGQTCQTLEARAEGGSGYKGCTHFYRAIQKYGWNSFDVEILKDDLTLDEANYWEEYYISYYDSANDDFGYNIRLGGSNASCNEEARKKISERAKERYKDPTKNPMYGKKHSLKSLKKMSEIKMGENNPMYGKKASEETKRKRAKTMKDKGIKPVHEWTEEERQRASIRFKQIAAEHWSRKICCIEDDLYFDTITSGAEYYGVDVSTLAGHLKGRQHTCRGRHFEYVD